MLPIALLITLSHLVLYEAVGRGGTAWLVAFFALVAALSALQSVFQPVYYVAIALLFGGLGSAPRRKILAVALVFLLPLALISAKNLYLFGSLTTSSWSGMHMADMSTEFLPLAERQRLVAAGRLSEVSLVRPFSPVEAYSPEFFRATSGTEVPLLSTPHTAHGGTNYHHLGYLAISRQYRDDALRTASSHPSTVLRALLRAWAAYFRPATDYFGLDPNRASIEAWRSIHDLLIHGRALWPSSFRWPRETAWREGGPSPVLLLSLPLLWVFGLSLVLRRGGESAPVTPAQRAVLALMCFNIAYVALVVNSLTAGENNRFRFVTDPLSLVLLGVLIERWRRRRAPPS